MCAYKLIKVRCDIFGIQGRVEKLLDSVEQGLYLRFHKQIFTLMDEWHGLSVDDIRKMEDRLKAKLDSTLESMDLTTRAGAAADAPDRLELDVEKRKIGFSENEPDPLREIVNSQAATTRPSDAAQ
jgi:hypothetical protein